MFGFFKRSPLPAAEPVARAEPAAQGDPVVDAVLMSGVVLPPYPQVLDQLDHLMARDDFELPRLVDLVAHDPSLRAALLRVANSPVFGLRQSVSSLLQAITLLGLARARAVLLSEVLRDALRDYGDPGLVQALWTRFSAIGNLAAAIAARSTALRAHADLAYTTGMFHGTGSFILVKRFPHETASLALAGKGYAAELERLAAQLGSDTVPISAMVARNWRLPAEVCAAIALQSHEPSIATAAGRLAVLLRLAIALHDAEHPGGEWPALWDSAAGVLGLDGEGLGEISALFGGEEALPRG